MNINKLLLKIALILLIINQANAQTADIPLTAILEKKAKLSQDFPGEKVHIHFDKPYYGIGDTIWFKAYVTLEQHVPSPLSKILYVELINQKDSLVESLKLPVLNSVSSGSIDLNYLNYKEGNYHIRAYTKWMLNQSPNYFFKKNIYIGNAINKDLQTHISYKGSITDKAYKVNSRIQYKDERGLPLSNKKVTWEVIADYERVVKGKGTTDNNGFIDLDFSSPIKVALNRGSLITTIDDGNDRSLTQSFPLKTAILENDIQFFPEGGEMIDGIYSNIGFKAIRSDGLGVEVKGKVLDNQGNEIATISSQHLGMGVFAFTPEKSKKYIVKVSFADGSQKTVNLPEVKTEGMSLSVNQIEGNLQIKINANQEYLSKNLNQGFYIIAQNAGNVYYAAQSTLKGTVYNGEVALDKFPTGILQLTLLSSNGLPLNERLVFIKRKDDLNIQVKTDLPVYAGRQKVKMSINNTGGLELAEGNFSVAVVDDGKVPFNEDEEITINSNLLLTSDLEGFIEQPNYYFNKTDTKKLADLDILMLTQGYRRFLFKDIIADKMPPLRFFPEQGIDISGTIRKSNGMPLDKGRLLLQIPDKYFSTTSTTNEEGKFLFSNMIFKDSSDVVINARNNINSKDLRITIDGDAYPSIYANINAPKEILNLDSALSKYLQNNKLEHRNSFMLREVVVKAGAIKKISHTDHSALTGLNMMADRVTSGEQLQGCGQFVNCLSGSGLTFIDNMLFLTRTYNQGIKIPIEIYVNNMPVDVSYLASINSKDVESIEVFNNDGLTGINKRTNTNGVLVINMKEVKKVPLNKDQLKDLFPPTNVLTYKPKGYAAERQFYLPKYSGPRTTIQPQDLRSTIYWNPIVITDKTGKATFEFFNGDEKGTYRVIVEGIDNNGNIGRSVSKYQVK